MELSYVQNESAKRAKVRDAFEIKERYGLVHEPGLVVVLDRIVTSDPGALVGRTATIFLPESHPIARRIDGAKDHIAANSLFFKNMTTGEVPIGVEIAIEDKQDST